MAQPGSVTRGFGGRVLYVDETAEGTTPTNPNFQKFSDRVQSASISLDPQNQTWLDIGDFDVATFTQGLPVYGFRVAFLLHTDRKTPVDDAITRQSTNALKSKSIEVSVGRDGANPGFFTFKGCKPQSCVVRSEVGGPVMVEIEYRALSVTRATTEPSVGTGSRESAALGALTVFSTSTIRRGASALGYITRRAEFRVAHVLNVEGTDGQTDPKAIFEGRREITGRADFSIDDGGKALADDVLAGTEATVDFNLGSTGAPKFSITGARWDNLEMPMDTEAGFIINGVPFTGKSITVGTV